MRARERRGGLILSETLSGLEFAFRIVPTSSWQIDVADSPPTKVIPAEMEGEGEKVSPRDFARRMIRSSREVNLDAVAHFPLAQLISSTCIGEISSSKRRNAPVASLRRTRFSLVCEYLRTNVDTFRLCFRLFAFLTKCSLWIRRFFHVRH